MGIYGMVVTGFPLAVSFVLTLVLALMYLRKITRATFTRANMRLAARATLRYLRSNLGAPFVLAFIVLLVAAAVEFSFGLTSEANELSEYAYFCILIGVVLQAVSVKLEKGSDERHE